ncbi:BamA/TamA family outer membrane protein [Anaeromyxobacter terrae]|uniref:BamA/TamA family outer membrane protein n=1 Tax=Anaeromyxobacter terrae TaxID=2925406 RepID=UPI001F55E16B|nr:BamA/TamA family outer membrane protein [Anaeromyxobacter sp. SG22]
MKLRSASALLLALALGAASTARAAEEARGADAAAHATDPAAGAASAETPAEPAAKAAAESVRAPPGGVRGFALPVLFWLPETKLGLGATGGLHLHVGGAPRASSVFAALVYTLEGQGSVDVAGDLTTRGGVFVGGRVRALHFPDVYYGLGPRSSEGDREPFTRRTVEGYLVAEWPIAGTALRAGPRVDFRAEEIRDLEAGGALASGGVPGARGFRGAGAGGSLTFDTRDSAFWPSRGAYAQAWYTLYPRALGDHGGLGRGLAEARKFLPLGSGRTLGLAGIAEWSNGDVPFTMLPRLGSTRFLRGIREGRYRDRLSWAGQAELRVPVRGRLSATAFGALGEVAHSPRDLGLDTIKVAGGAGLRWRLTDEGANIRLDVAAGPAGPELYVLVLEAF